MYTIKVIKNGETIYLNRFSSKDKFQQAKYSVLMDFYKEGDKHISSSSEMIIYKEETK